MSLAVMLTVSSSSSGSVVSSLISSLDESPASPSFKIVSSPIFSIASLLISLSIAVSKLSPSFRLILSLSLAETLEIEMIKANINSVIKIFFLLKIVFLMLINSPQYGFLFIFIILIILFSANKSRNFLYIILLILYFI